MYDEEIEKAVLYHLIFQNEQFNLKENDFVNATHKRIIKAINELKAKKEEISLLTISNRLNDIEGILEYLAMLDEHVFYTSAETSYKTLKKHTKKRDVFTLGKQMQMEVRDTEDIDIYIEKEIKTLQEIELQTRKEKDSIDRFLKTIKEVEKQMNNNGDVSLYTGFFGLDNLTGGLHEGELTVIGARPAVGKSTFALQIAENIAKKEKKVVYISLEMSEEQITQKQLSRNSRINSKKIKNGNLTEGEFIKLNNLAGLVSQQSLTVITDTNTIQKVELETRRMKNRNNLDLLIIDYLTLLGNTENFKSREQEVANISRTLKLLSLELNIPIIALCQLNRNANRNEPTLADIRESGAIEQDADNVIFLYNDSNDKEDIITVDLQKQRTGDTGRVRLKFLKQYSEFVNLER